MSPCFGIGIFFFVLSVFDTNIQVWTSNIYALGGFLLLLFFVLLCHLPQRRRVQETSRNLDVSTTARVVSSNLALLLGFPVGSQRVFRRLLGEDVFRRVELF